MAQAELFSEDYKVNLDVFEGPLDLLLYLIRREELDIYDIPIGRVTGQYMEYLDLMRQLNLDVAGEFIVMAATLMVIKSRMLLPVERRVTEEGTDEEWVDPRLDLVRQLIEYKKFKDAAGRLGQYELYAQESFKYGGGRPVFKKTSADAAGALESVDIFDLLTAFQNVIARMNEAKPGELKGARWSVPDKMDMVLKRSHSEGRMSFSRLFNEESPRGEVIVTFLALLELLRQHRIVVYQNAAFHEITILPSYETPEGLPLETPDEW
jgi:segregation and condensation protein A